MPREMPRIHAGTLFVLLTCTGTAAAGGTASGGPHATALLAPQDPPASGFLPRTGFFVELHGAWTDLGGDFDGDTLLMGGTDSIEIPDADAGLGFGLALGHRWNRHALELAYTRTEHDGSVVLGTGGDVVSDVVDLDYRFFFRPDERFQPFLQAGVGAAFATLEDASTGGSGTGDGELSGVTFNLGVGAEYYFSERFSVGLRALYRFTSFDTAEGVDGDEGSIDESVDASGPALVLGASFTL